MKQLLAVSASLPTGGLLKQIRDSWSIFMEKSGKTGIAVQLIAVTDCPRLFLIATVWFRCTDAP